MSTDFPAAHDADSVQRSVSFDREPDIELLTRVEADMARVEATLGQLAEQDADPVSLTSWIAPG